MILATIRQVLKRLNQSYSVRDNSTQRCVSVCTRLVCIYGGCVCAYIYSIYIQLVYMSVYIYPREMKTHVVHLYMKSSFTFKSQKIN